MSDDNTPMAHLVPRLTSQVESAATDALGYILNRSPSSMQALNDLLQEGGFDIEPIAKVETQITYEDGSRPDMAGYDKNNVKRLLVEAKFWAALLEGQASGYVRQFDHPGPAVLLFICPEIRIPTLWVEVERQFESQSVSLASINSAQGTLRAKVTGTERHVMLVSWVRLLDRMDAMVGDDGVKSDIRQLRGLAHVQDAQAFLPIHSEEMSPGLGRRVAWYNQIVDDVVYSKGVPQGWMNTKGLKAVSLKYGYGRYFRFSDAEGWTFWFGVNHDRWADKGDTPLWLRSYKGQEDKGWMPIHPKLGVEYSEVLDDVVSQLKERIAEIVAAKMHANNPDELQQPDALDDIDLPEPIPEQREAFRQRMSDPSVFMTELYQSDGSLVVGEGYIVFTPERRRRLNAQNIASSIVLYQNDNKLSIALGLAPKPEDESDEEREERLVETQLLAMGLAGQGEFDVAIELGYLPKPKVEPEPRKVDTDGNLVQAAIAIEFAAEKRATPRKAGPIDNSNDDTWPPPEAELKARREKENEEFEAARHAFWKLVPDARTKAEVRATGRDVYAARTKEELEAARTLFWELENAEDGAPVWERTGWERTGIMMIAAWAEAYPYPMSKEMIEARRDGRTDFEMECARWRLSSPLS